MTPVTCTVVIIFQDSRLCHPFSHKKEALDFYYGEHEGALDAIYREFDAITRSAVDYKFRQISPS